MTSSPPAPVLITGCSSGIGRAAALRLVRSGRPVWATARSVESLAELRAAGCVVRRLDVTDAASAAAVVDEITAEHGAVGVLVNNAGYGEYGPIEEVSMDRWQRQFDTNVFGVVRLCQLVLPGMRTVRSGRIINVSSMGGRVTLPGGGAYHASKYAIEAISDALRFEVRGYGIRVTLIEPGPVLTDFVEEAATPAAEEGAYAGFARAVAERNATAYSSRRATNTPDEIAAVIERAATASRPRARYLVGSTARGLVAARAMLGSAGFDALLRTQLPSPTTPR